ncbi:hypothetical protein [Dactylosporangium sp. CA-233914]|uniref:hypothetical protein n=1 Tax=Dactylosporangium sp. CA-233914 TaxID=3239934 RepID=UPI003D949D76
MPGEDEKQAAHRALVDRIVNGPGHAAAEQRAAAFANAGLPVPLDTLVGKVNARPVQVTDADFAAAKAAGVSEDADPEVLRQRDKYGRTQRRRPAVATQDQRQRAGTSRSWYAAKAPVGR